MASSSASALLRVPADLHPRARDVLNFWFGDSFTDPATGAVDPAKKTVWYAGGPELDAHIQERFGGDLEDLATGRHADWTAPHEQLAAIILADQLTRNAYRGTARMYSLDELALKFTDELLAGGYPRLPPMAQGFVLMPLMHSEELARHEQLRALIQERIAALQQPGSDESAAAQFDAMLKFGDAHTAVVRRWGRYPHRNAILGRESTPEEAAGMADGSIPAW